MIDRDCDPAISHHRFLCFRFRRCSDEDEEDDEVLLSEDELLEDEEDDDEEEEELSSPATAPVIAWPVALARAFFFS